MQKLSIKEADNFLNEHFKLFIEKKLEEGFNYRIVLSSDNNNPDPDYFYVKFWNDSGNPKNYKIVCRR
jgi:hypothetical protein